MEEIKPLEEIVYNYFHNMTMGKMATAQLCCRSLHVLHTLYILGYLTPSSMGGAFHKKLMGQNGSLAGFSAILRHKNKNLSAEMSRNVTVLHCLGETPSF